MYTPKNRKEKKLLQAIARGLDEVKLMQEGKLAKKLASDFVKELQAQVLRKIVKSNSYFNHYCLNPTKPFA